MLSILSCSRSMKLADFGCGVMDRGGEPRGLSVLRSGHQEYATYAVIGSACCVAPRKC